MPDPSSISDAPARGTAAARVGVGLATDPEPAQAAAAAASSALASLERAEAALVFTTPRCGPDPRKLLEAAAEALGTRSLAGCSAHGVLAGGLEVEAGVAVSVIAFAGFEIVPFGVPELRDCEQAVGGEIVARVGRPLDEQDLVVLLPDASSCAPTNLLATLSASLGGAAIVGAGAAPVAAENGGARGGRTGAALQWCGLEALQGGLAGLVVRASEAPRIGITQSCVPVTEPLTVTRTRGHWILELDGRPALDVYREVARGPLAADLRRAAAVLLVALPVADEEGLRDGRYLVRNVAGFAEGPKAFAVAQAVRPGDRLALALRDAQAAREDLKRMLAATGADRADSSGALYFSCCARGSSFFGVSGLEAAYVQRALGAVPSGGMFGACEIGPVGVEPQLLTYTGVLALLGS